MAVSKSFVTPRPRSLLLAAFVLLAHCRRDPEAGATWCPLEDDWLGAVLSSLRGWAERAPAGIYSRPIERIEQVVSVQNQCLPGRDPPELTLDLIATDLLTSPREPLRQAGLEIACGMCLERGSPCTCEGRACSPQDIAVDVMGSRLVCGAVILDDYRVVLWGNGVRQLPK